jgi:hypothetical protein
MEYVPLDADRKIPKGRMPVPAGCESNGLEKLYFATGRVPKSTLALLFGGEDDKIVVPGKWGEHIDAVMVPYGETEVEVKEGGAVLCWKK